MKANIVAFYLPQYHPTAENNAWWGKGFTEWTCVAQSRALYRHHRQPNIPADLGFYDLRLPEVRAEQACLAREAGIAAFCYWHYWMGGGKRLLNYPLDEVVRLGQPDFPSVWRGPIILGCARTGTLRCRASAKKCWQIRLIQGTKTSTTISTRCYQPFKTSATIKWTVGCSSSSMTHQPYPNPNILCSAGKNWPRRKDCRGSSLWGKATPK